MALYGPLVVIGPILFYLPSMPPAFLGRCCQQIALMLGLYVEESMSSATVLKMPLPAVPWIEEIFRDHHQLVYRTACVITGSPDDAEDVLQTIFLRLIAQQVPPNLKNPRAYFYSAAVKVSLSVLRARRRHVLTADSDVFETPPRSGDSEIDDLLRSQLYRAIESLSPRTVEILMLRYVEDLTEPQIAKLLGRSRGTVAVTLFRALGRLRKLLRTNPSGENV
jgi:RNA polymerase sigma factor (sigma-70 family)